MRQGATLRHPGTLVVVYVYREPDVIRLISAWKANRRQHRDFDFSQAKRGAVVKTEPGKTKISIRLDNAVLSHFRHIVDKAGGGNYQTLINSPRTGSRASR